MASIKNAFDEALNDSNAIFKYVFYAIPVYVCTQAYLANIMFDEYWFLYVFAFLIMFGFLLICTNNVRNGKNQVLPSFNFLGVIWASIKGLIALGPAILINFGAAYYISDFIQNYISDTNIFLAVKIIIWGLFTSFFITIYLNYTRSFKIFDAYNLKTIFKFCGTVLIAFVFMLPQLILAAMVLILPAGYILWLLKWLTNPIGMAYWSIILMFSVAMCGHYLANIDFETIEAVENRKKN